MPDGLQLPASSTLWKNLSFSFSLSFEGPDFRKLNQLSQLLQGSEVSISPRLLQSSSPSVQQEEFQATVDALQARGCYSQARQVAQLAGLPVHRLLLSQVRPTCTLGLLRACFKIYHLSVTSQKLIY